MLSKDQAVSRWMDLSSSEQYYQQIKICCFNNTLKCCPRIIEKIKSKTFASNKYIFFIFKKDKLASKQ